MHRCYLPEADFSSAAPLAIEGAEAHHALRVMRLREGDECEVFDGCGRAARARITHAAGSRMQLAVLEQLAPLPPMADITLGIAIPKGALMELIVQKAVEMGVRRIVPLMTERTIVRLNEKEALAKAEKWRRTALEACKQCGVSLLPTVEAPQSYAAWLAGQEAPPLRLQCALLPHARPLREVLEAGRAAGQTALALLIGPEGDFSPAEYAAGESAGYTPVSLGSIILRVETAVFYSVAAARYALDPPANAPGGAH